MNATRRETLRLSTLWSLAAMGGLPGLAASAQGGGRGLAGPTPTGPRRWGVNPTWPKRWLGQWLPGDLATLADQTSRRSFDDAQLAAIAAGAPLTLSAGEELYCIADNGGLTPGGDWTVQWSGTGSCSLKVLGARATSGGPARGGARSFRLGPGATHVFVVADASDPADPVRGVRLWHDTSNPERLPINPAAAETLRGANTIRCMDWGRTNANPIRAWSERTAPDAAMQSTAHGVALELQLELAEAAGASCWWLCVPPLAGVGYSRELGRWLAANTPDDLEVKVEYGNEVWNFAGDFSVFHRHVLGLPDVDDPRRPGTITNHYAAKYGTRAAEHAAAVREAFPRARFVVGAQTANPWIGETALLAAAAAGQPGDFLALTGYFSDGWDQKLAGGEVGLDGFFEGLADRLTDASRWEKVADSVAIARKNGAEVVMYEGGTHCLPPGGGTDGLDLLMEAHRDPRFRELAQLNAEGWFTVTGNAEYLHFGDAYRMTRHGFWGFCESNLTPDGRPTPVREDPRLGGVLDAVAAG